MTSKGDDVVRAAVGVDQPLAARVIVAPADEADRKTAREHFLGEPLEGAVVGVYFRQMNEFGVKKIKIARPSAHVGDAHHVLSSPEGLPEGRDGEPVVGDVG